MSSLAVRFGQWLQLAVTQVANRVWALNILPITSNGDPVSATNPQAVKLMLEKPNAVLVNASADEWGSLRVIDQYSDLAVSEGLVPGYAYVHKFGKAPLFNIASGYVTIWDGADTAVTGSPSYVYSSGADIDSISSSNATDAQVIRVLGLDVNYNEVNQAVTLNGQARVALGTVLRRVYRMYNAGITDLVGNVYCYVNTTISAGVPTDATKVRAIIKAGNNQTLMTLYTVPAGKTAYMQDFYVALAGAIKSSLHNVRVFTREIGGVFRLKMDITITEVGTSYLQHHYENPERIPEKTDIAIRCNTDSNSAGVSAGFDLVLVDN